MKIFLVARRSIISTSLQLLLESRFDANVLLCQDCHGIKQVLRSGESFRAAIILDEPGVSGREEIISLLRGNNTELPVLSIRAAGYPASLESASHHFAPISSDAALSDIISRMLNDTAAKNLHITV